MRKCARAGAGAGAVGYFEGVCGKRDGQLLYPNRVAVVRSSGDIIVTERSPTHQVSKQNNGVRKGVGARVRKCVCAGALGYFEGECGKRDGQLLYPNRVAVVRSSGDIIVTERSPTHLVCSKKSSKL